METHVQSTTKVIIPGTINGPPTSGHGGASAGMFAVAAGFGDASVRFQAPIPLATELAIERDGDLATVADGESTVAIVRPLETGLVVGEFERLADADIVAAEARFLDHHDGDHMAPTCFACGNLRTDSAGLLLRPGTVVGTGVMATSWSPNLNTDAPQWLIWAALDCPSGIPALAQVELHEAVVTGELNVEIRAAVPGRGNYQIHGRCTSRKGRKFTTEAALLDDRGHALAVATATWIVVPKVSLQPQPELAIAA